MLSELFSSLSIILAKEALSISFLMKSWLLFDDEGQNFRRCFDREVEVAQIINNQIQNLILEESFLSHQLLRIAVLLLGFYEQCN